jgi:hypothetical protein
MSTSPALAPRRWAAGAAGAVFALGFGMLAVASVFGLGEQSLPGLFTFRSATVGDAVLLPLLAYHLIRSCGPLREWGRTVRRAVLVVVVAGILAGIASQASWLMEPHPRTNWTFPAAGRFNFVGWYHAAFLTVACGFFSGAAAAAIGRLRRSRSTSCVRSIGVLGVLVPALGFVALLSEDNAAGRSDLIELLARLALLTLAVGGLLIWALGWTAGRWCALACMATLLPAVSMSLLFLPGSIASVMTVLPTVCAALAGAFGASVIRPVSFAGRIAVPLCTAVCAAGPIHAFASLPTTTILGLASGSVISAALVVLELLLVRALLGATALGIHQVVWTPLAAVPFVAFSLSGRYFAQEQRLVTPYAVIAGVVAAVLFLAVCARGVRILFAPVIRAEEANAPEAELAELKWSAYLAVSTVYAGALVSCVASLVGSTPADKWLTGSNRGFGLLVILALALVALVVVCHFLAPSFPAVAPLACLVWVAVMVVQLANGYGDWKQASLSIMAALTAGLFVLEGVMGNMGRLQNLQVTRQLWVTGVSSALAAGATTAWATGPALWSDSGVASVPFAFMALLVSATATMLLPWLATRVLPGARPPQRYRPGTPTAGVLQDCFIVTVLGTSVAWIPNLFMAHIGDTASWWTTVFPFFALLSRAYVYIMMNNVGHVQREHSRVADLAASETRQMTEGERGALVALAGHIQRQNRIALMALVPLGLFVLFNEITGFDEHGLRQIASVGSPLALNGRPPV